MPTNYPPSHVAESMGDVHEGFGFVHATVKSGNPATDLTVKGKVTLDLVRGVGVVAGRRIGEVPENLAGDVDMVFSLATKQVNFKRPVVSEPAE